MCLAVSQWGWDLSFHGPLKGEQVFGPHFLRHAVRELGDELIALQPFQLGDAFLQGLQRGDVLGLVGGEQGRSDRCRQNELKKTHMVILKN